LGENFSGKFWNWRWELTEIMTTSHQKPISAIHATGVGQETLPLSANPDFIKIIDKARAEFKSGKMLSLEEMKIAVYQDA
jgi:hypothetical protein